MMSKIEWTEQTWNPVTGCTKVSAGCKHCYAERMAGRLQAMGQPNYRNGFKLTTHEHMLDIPLKRKKPTMYFVCSMSDLFHPDVPGEFIARVFDAMRSTPQHTYQVLTKRAARMATLAPKLDWPGNVWAGVSMEAQHVFDRASCLRTVPAPVRFLSCEPLLGPLNLNLSGIHWVIVGGESGPHARPMNPDWVRGVRDQCVAADVPFFFKQWGGKNKKKAGRLLDGQVWDQMPGIPSDLAG
jgi:protein gp37